VVTRRCHRRGAAPMARRWRLPDQETIQNQSLARSLREPSRVRLPKL